MYRKMRVFVPISILMSNIFASNQKNNDVAWESIEERHAFRSAACIAICEKNYVCRDDCHRGRTSSSGSTIDSSIFEEKSEWIFSGTAKFNATLHCKDVDVIGIKHNPGIWIIQEIEALTDSRSATSGRVVEIKVSNESITAFGNLSAAARYRYKAYEVTGPGVVTQPETSRWFETSKIGDVAIKGAKAARLLSVEPDEKNPARLRADIALEHTSDRDCYYDVISWSEDGDLAIGVLDLTQDFHFSLRNLEYDKKMTVSVSGRGADEASRNGSSGVGVSLSFATPSCFEIRRSLEFCAPERVKGLRIRSVSRDGARHEVQLEWDHPATLPDNYTLQVESLDRDDSGNDEYYPITIPGNASRALLSIETNDTEEAAAAVFHRRIMISILAESAGGTSARSWIYATLNQSPSVPPTGAMVNDGIGSSFQDEIIVIPSAVITLAIVIGIVCSRIRRNRQSHKGYKYCQMRAGGALPNIGEKGNSESLPVVERSGGDVSPTTGLSSFSEADRFEIRPGQLTISDDILGSGASGIVRHGTFRITQSMAIDVAVKTLKDNFSADDLNNFRQEISIMKSAGQHPNIVSIIGCCRLELARPLLIVEYCSRGDLQSYLRAIWQTIMTRGNAAAARAERRRSDFRGSRIVVAATTATATKVTGENCNGESIDGHVAGPETAATTLYAPPRQIERRQFAVTNRLYDVHEVSRTLEVVDSAADAVDQQQQEERITAGDLLNFARQVATGMEFLSLNRIIHRDLAARNVLLCSDMTVKISDFGLSRDIYRENIYKKEGSGRLPLKWMALEALTHQIYTTQSDVWSFGILLWEIVTLGCNPYPETPTNMVLELLKSGYRMEKPENCGKELYETMLACWQSRPRSRPTFAQLRHRLDSLLRTVSDNEYLNVYDLDDSLATALDERSSPLSP